MKCTRRFALCSLLTLPCVASAWAADARSQDTPAEPSDIQRIVAVQNVCAWPNLTVLPDGTMAAVIFNRPSHGSMEGDVECWASAHGQQWDRRSTITEHAPHTVRMNAAAGLAADGDFLVVCSGWTDQKQPNRPKQSPFRDDILRSWVCRSTDGGRTWTKSEDFPAPEAGWTEYVPFGDVLVAADRSLRMSCYHGRYTDPTASSKTNAWRSWLFRSDDDGASWKPTTVIGPKNNETFLFHSGETRWLAAARLDAMELFRSDDDGRTWQGPQRVTARNEINAHLARLADGRLLMTYGNRVDQQFGVLAKLSTDDGATWGRPLRLAHSNNRDCGYPSSVQRPDGQIVTAYYSKSAPECERYHMGVAIWQPPTR